MGKPRIVVSDDRYHGDYEIERRVLSAIGAELEVPSAGSFRAAAKGADGILVNLRKIDAEAIAELANCKVLSRYGVGFDNVDVAAASAAGIWVATVPDYSVEEVTDQTLALLLACARLVVFKDASIRAGNWDTFGGMRVRRIKGSALGLVGYGHIGRRFHEKSRGLDFGQVLVYDPYVDAETIAARGGRKCGLDELLSAADFISVHAPLTPETRHLIGAREIDLMKEEATVVNTARGAIVDGAALAAALASGRIKAAGLDVHETEPIPPGSPLLSLDNVVLSDHCAYYSEESIRELKEKAARNIVAALAEGRPVSPINDGIRPRT